MRCCGGGHHNVGCFVLSSFSPGAAPFGFAAALVLLPAAADGFVPVGEESLHADIIQNH